MSDRVSRRRVLQATAAGTAASVAGCLGDGGGDGASRVCREEMPAPHRGDPDADVTVMVFEDFACPHCRDYVLEYLPQIASEYIEPGKIRYEHHDYPIPVSNPESWRAASAARAVQDNEGLSAFWTYSKRLYEEQSTLGLETYASLAEEVDTDPDTVRSAAEDRCYEPVVQSDKRRGNDLGVQNMGTPAVFVDGQALQNYSAAAVSNAIDTALEFAEAEDG